MRHGANMHKTRSCMKKDRHGKIIELIERYDIETQEELADRLRQEGYQVTQATVSRDIRALKLSKISNGKGHQKYIAFHQDEAHMGDRYIRVLKEGYVSMDLAQNLLVMKTVSGMAMAVAACVDSFQYHEIVGTIAGDDTVMVAIRSVQDALVVQKRIRLLLSEA